MIDKIIAYSVRNALTVGIFTLLLIIAGIYSLQKLPVDAVPDVTGNQVDIITNSPSLASLEMELFITAPIEMAMSNIPGIEEIRSTSKFGLSVVKIIFSDDTDVYWARQQVFERLEEVQSEIPNELGKPYMGPVSTGLGEVFQYVIRPKDPEDKSFSLMEIRTLQDWVIRKQLLGTPGIAEVSGFGGYRKEYQAKIKPERMRALGVTIDELYQALSTGNSNTGGAYIEKNNQAFTIRGIGLASNLEEVGNTVIRVNERVPVLVKDVADVSYGNTIRYGAITMNGTGEVVGGIIMMMKGENGNEVIGRIKEKMKVIQANLPEGLIIEPFIDREKLVSQAIATVATNLVEGAIIVMLVILVFLGNWRASLLAASVIPLSMLFAFILMNQTGVVGNLMSLGVIDFGLLVDPAIIVVESVVLFLALAMANKHKGQKLNYVERQETVINAAQDVKRSVVFGGLIILIVYFPIITLTGVEGKMFTPMAKTVSFAILGALILSVTYVPMMSAVILRPSAHGHGPSEKIVQFLYKGLEKIIKFGLRRKYMVISFAVLVMMGGIIGFNSIGGEFLPKLQEGDMVIEVNLPVGTSLTESIKLSTKIQARLMEAFPDEVERVVSKIGTSEVPVDPMPLEAQEIVVVLKNKKLWKKAKAQEDLAELVAEVMEEFPGIVVSIQQPIENRVNELMSGARTDVVVKLFGENLDTLVRKGNQIISIVKTIEGATDVQENKIYGLPQINIKYDRKQMAYYGVTVSQINRAVQTAFGGATAGIIYEKDKRFDLTMRLAGDERTKEENIINLLINDKDGNPIPLSELADITEDIGPSEIGHENLQRRLNIGFNVRGRDLESVVNDVMAAVNQKVYIPKGYIIDYGGEFENFRRAKARLAIVVPLALFIIFCLLYATFRTVRDSLLIYTVVPLSAVGGVFSLLLRDMNFSISAGVGFIALFGVAVLNGILLVGCFNDYGKRGIFNPERRVLMGLKERFRPVLMTSAVAALGFLPMALSTSVGAEVQKPLATVVIGGLFTATVLTLIVLPVLYTIFQKRGTQSGNPKEGSSGSMIIKPAVIILLMFSAAPAMSQVKLSEEDAITLALKNNPEIKVSVKKVEQQRTLKPAAINLGGPDLLVEAPNGDIMRPGIMQGFQYPGVYTAQYKSQQRKVEMAEAEKDVSENFLIYRVRNVYTELQFLVEKVNLLKEQDSIYSDILKANEVRLKVGEISNLEKINGEAQYRRIQYNLTQSLAELASTRIQFGLLMGYPENDGFLPANKLQKAKLLHLNNGLDSSAVMSNPLISLNKKEEAFSKTILKVERRKRIPGLAIGYLNQAPVNEHSPSTYGIRAGLTLPIWYWVQNSGIKAAKKSVEISRTQTEVTAYQLQTEYSKAVFQYRQYKQNDEYFATIGLIHAAEILKSAKESYKLGSIGYYAYLQNLELVFQTRMSYLENLKNFNQSVNYIEYLQGKNGEVVPSDISKR